MLEWNDMLIAALRTLFGQWSASMLLLIFLSGWRLVGRAQHGILSQSTAFGYRQLRSWLTVMLLIALLFYPLALGFGRFDPYALGFDQRLVVICAVCALAAAWRYPLVSIWLVLAAVVHAAGMGESNNLWDYLFDPLSIIWALIWWLRQCFGGLKSASGYANE